MGYNFDLGSNKWITNGGGDGHRILSSNSRMGDGFGYSMDMSPDGSLLVIGSKNAECKPYSNRFTIDKCTIRSIEAFIIQSSLHRFLYIILNTLSPYTNDLDNSNESNNILDLSLLSSWNILDLHASTSGQGNLLLLSGLVNDKSSTNSQISPALFYEAYGLKDLFNTRCAVEFPSWLGDGICSDFSPYNSSLCGFDKGDCVGNPECIVDESFYARTKKK